MPTDGQRRPRLRLPRLEQAALRLLTSANAHHYHQEKGGHGGHHGGAWKVAYADFVTAMMALFIVLWLMNTSKQVQEAVGGYFKDPAGTSKKVGSNQIGSGENFTLTKDNMAKLKEELQKAMRQMTNFDKLKNQIEMTVTSEGLRIELLESPQARSLRAANRNRTEWSRSCWLRSRMNWARFPTTSPSKATPTPNPTLRSRRIQQLGALR